MKHPGSEVRCRGGVVKKKGSKKGGTRQREVFLVSAEQCDGCGECVVKCKKTLKRDEPCIQIVKVGERYVPIVCQNCQDAPCVTACMPGCRYKDEKHNRVVTDYKRCVGCWMCIMLCPFGAIKRIPKKKGVHFGVAQKCDGCLDKAEAACMTVCKVKGLQMTDPHAYSNEKRKKAALNYTTIIDGETE